MELVLLGTGCPKVDHKRFGPANLVSTSKTNILVDCGSGVTQRLEETKVSSANIDALVLTHLHSDHVIDFYQLIISSWHSYRTKPWKIYGPKGTKKFFRKIMESWKDERDLRIKYEKRSSTLAFKLEIEEFKKYGKIKIKDIFLEYFMVDHKPVKYAYGFNFYKDKKKLTISGDTRPCENLIKYSQLADVLLHEVFIEGEILQIGKATEIYEKPKSIFVANFLANPVNNIFKSQISIIENEINIALLNINIDLKHNEKIKDFNEIYFSIRPEHIYIEKKRKYS